MKTVNIHRKLMEKKLDKNSMKLFNVKLSLFKIKAEYNFVDLHKQFVHPYINVIDGRPYNLN